MLELGNATLLLATLADMVTKDAIAGDGRRVGLVLGGGPISCGSLGKEMEARLGFKVCRQTAPTAKEDWRHSILRPGL